MMMKKPERKRPFRSYTLNFSSQKARTTIFTMGLAIAVFSILICVVAVQLIAGTGQKGLAGKILHSISDRTLGHVISQEIPLYASVGPALTIAESTVTPKGIGNMLLYLFADIDASNPLTLLGYQVPGMSVADFKLLTPDPKYDTPPQDHDHDEQPNIDRKPREEKVTPPPPPVEGPLVYVYHSHNRESFLPAPRLVARGVTEADNAYDEKENIELAGTWMVEALQSKGIPSIQTLEDYWVKGSFNEAYNFSRITVQEVLKKHGKSLKLIFDVHRDSLPKEKTTRVINGENYASVYFITGAGNNPHADKNNAMLKKLSEDYMAKMYPGLSRGVWMKNSTQYDTRYNQDLSPNMGLIEIGGPGNTLDEVKRTAEAVANVVAAYLKDLEKLNPQVPLPSDK